MLTPPVTSLTPHKFGRWERAAGEGDWLSDVIIPRTPSSEAGTGRGMSKLDVPRRSRLPLPFSLSSG